MTRVLVTGANGLIGSALCGVLSASGAQVRAAVRGGGRPPVAGDAVVIGDLGPETDWAEALRGVDAVVHLAARVHMLRDTVADPLAAYRLANVAGTARLARSCAEAGVHRLVYVSSVKVNGESTGDRPFTESDPPAPEDAYGVSKWEAECAARRIAEETGLEVVVVRPCLAYGPGVRGNLARLLGVLSRGVPLPLASVRNRRSLIGVENLCHLLATCVDHPAAAGETFLASDGEDLSTPELIRALASGLGRPARLFPVPVRALELAAKLSGRTAAYARVCGSLQVDGAKARGRLGWTPPIPAVLGLLRTGEWYREGRA